MIKFRHYFKMITYSNTIALFTNSHILGSATYYSSVYVLHCTSTNCWWAVDLFAYDSTHVKNLGFATKILTFNNFKFNDFKTITISSSIALFIDSYPGFCYMPFFSLCFNIVLLQTVR